jgi:hypothetical protein
MSDVGETRTFAPTSTFQQEPLLAAPLFGIYRLATGEWQDSAREVLAEAVPSVQGYLRCVQPNPELAERFSVNDLFATTFMQRQDSRDCLGRENLQFDRVLEQIGELAASSGVVTVPIARLMWRGNCVAGALDCESSEYRSLIDHQAAIGRILEEAGLLESPVRRPHHVSLGRYSPISYSPDTRLNATQRASVLHLVGGRLARAEIDAVDLGKTIVGQSYSSPFRLRTWLRQMRQHAAARDQELRVA